MPNLFSPIQIGRFTLPNRIFMAPLTRCRSSPGDHIPSELMIQHYADRASAGLTITECSMIAPKTSAFFAEPGVYSPEQLAVWKKITDAVHAKGGKIFCQIWHAGRGAHPEHNDGAEPVGPSAIAIDGFTYTPSGRVPFVVPRELTLNEIAAIVQQFATAARNCVEIAGFDGVEVHAANGFLVDQFLKASSNTRTDAYGGSPENRTRFLREVVSAVVDAIGGDRVGVRFSPLNTGFIASSETDPEAFAAYVASTINAFDVAYVHAVRRDNAGQLTGDIVPIFRQHYKGTLVTNAQYSQDEATEAIEKGETDAVAFGKAWLANADLVARFERQAPLNTPDPSTFYSGGAKGYNDYPLLA
ncbi:N-ethylmaleimide reductase [Saprolegnia diclina VS20]|uniref:N-ethylmaleimide reductase n=1 Tax=Saprolegnia diclina (strain VS20) TaxID=1156394 RepID=T0QQR0_SAPDV|nr:N-ethylmaleimide reductase [Saprolegnia diclina VS20]EQC40444.1 N-ethylmaleimide reductase [Saprolegnia diclina VS20]|eukprot:XP_008606143.1 N-ethylmaleimide reductase [Saprolegnia diclina VS20]